MSIFNLGDVTFDPYNRNIDSSKNLLGGKTYGYNILRYPIDLGAVDKGHYMVIHINAQKRTQVADKRAHGSDLPTIYDNRIMSGNLGIGGAAYNILSNIGLDWGKSYEWFKKFGFLPIDESFAVGFVRTIYRTTDTIALYMPDTLAFNQNQQFSDLSLTGPIAAGLAGLGTGIDTFKDVMAGADMSSFIKNLAPFVVSGAVNSNPMFQAGFAAITGMVVNPMLEVLYTSPEFRQFRFDFMFYPRSKKEAKEVQNIIERIRFHQSPEIKKDSYGFFLIPPSEFDIKFYYNGKENENIPKISTCVLVGMDIDYAPQGFAAYEVPGESTPELGGTGMPVGIRLSLNFKETEYLTKENYNQGDNK